ncbi:MAG: nucleotidyltransferase domain-containing protein [Candidatus Sericytochromatia bacterium]
MDLETEISDIVNELTNKHNCHTIIVYGSRANNTHNENSDIDLACFIESGESYTDCRLRDNLYLDAWIYPENYVLSDGEKLKLLNGKVLIQKENFGDNILAMVNDFYKKGPPKIKESEFIHEVTWCEKTLKRVLKGDIEGNYRRLLLISALLEYYFMLSNKWYLGAKASLLWLKQYDIEMYNKFDLLFAHPENNENLQEVVNFITQVLPNNNVGKIV